MRLGARPQQVDWQRVRCVLADAPLALYVDMPLGDQIHALRVLECLGQAGTVSPELEQAALLHDVGKTHAGLNLLYRTVIVLLRAVQPRWLAALSAKDSSRWRRPFYYQARHAELGAEMCRRAGCSEHVVALVRCHEGGADVPLDPVAAAELAALRRADDQC